MASTRRRQSVSVIQKLCGEPYRFEFFQAVRNLEHAVLIEKNGEDSDDVAVSNVFAREPVAGAAPPVREAVRFKAQSSLSFVAADVIRIEERKLSAPVSAQGWVNNERNEGPRDSLNTEESDPEKQWSMEVGFSGLVGSQGVMPYYLTEVLHRELREKSTALRDFLDIFHHRNISLFYRAWQKYRLPVNYESAKRRKAREPDLFSQALASIAGLGTSELQYRIPIPDDVLYGMAGHLGRQQCSAAALESMVRQYFGLKVTIEQFQGQWDDLPEDVLTRLPGPQYPLGVNNRLGTDTILGTQCFQAQNKFRLLIEPLDYSDHMAIAPGSEKLEALKSFIQLSAGIEMDFEISATLNTNQVSPVQLTGDDSLQPLLGWNTHMAGDQDQDEQVVVSLSADQMSPEEALPAA
ncbi:type VI secretion system baseplate subunit TssG [Microbulbifer salipaludis]|uniref:Type VI secretion system baseplate subunit TssG n=1 Tax=Microbulbifer salipaludis TaxID=187980 RepID=A0ABS3E463_9GAMM|nr:type VI secretion system baseplate subunit TssG [Microbulbifer salipaludis]MBN8429899.1 type VI secretion system baseplate subunit TssG [Microbulbifer salipaludis]